jgi:hypothetical protein
VALPPRSATTGSRSIANDTTTPVPNAPRRPRAPATSALLAATWPIWFSTAHPPVSRRARCGRQEGIDAAPCSSSRLARSASLLFRRLSGCSPALGAWLATGWPAYFGRSMPMARPAGANLLICPRTRSPAARCPHALRGLPPAQNSSFVTAPNHRAWPHLAWGFGVAAGRIL